ncbi:MAG: hypothetical protein IJ597_06310, partial [Synergistaceae bacterium]|nr:hypothetical protein [Synergistaceae bacterium]
FNCRACGAPLDFQNDSDFAFCPYCGVKQSIKNSIGGTRIQNLLERIFTFLEEGNFHKTAEYCERVLDINLREPQAYLAKLMVD